MKKYILLFSIAAFFVSHHVFATGGTLPPPADPMQQAIDESNKGTSQPSEQANRDAVERANKIDALVAGGMSRDEATKSVDSSTSSTVSVQTSEYVPGAGCTCIAGGTKGEANKECAPGTPTPKYECSVGKGLTSFQGMIATIVRWFVNIVLLLGVLAIVGAGILMSFGSESEEYTKKAKGWAVNIIIGLIILFTFRYILGLLAPWIYQ